MRILLVALLLTVSSPALAGVCKKAHADKFGIDDEIVIRASNERLTYDIKLFVFGKKGVTTCATRNKKVVVLSQQGVK